MATEERLQSAEVRDLEVVISRGEGSADGRLEEAAEKKGKGIKLRSFWSPGEDEKLKNLVEQYGARNWKKISSEIGGRAPSACRCRWLYRLKPTLEAGVPESSKKPQTSLSTEKRRRRGEFVETGATTLTGLKVAGEDSKMSTEEDLQSMIREFEALINPGERLAEGRVEEDAAETRDQTERTFPWSPSEDMKLKNLVEQCEAPDWKKISSEMSGRSPLTCRTRWHSHVKPALEGDIPESSKKRRTSSSSEARKRRRGERTVEERVEAGTKDPIKRTPWSPTEDKKPNDLVEQSGGNDLKKIRSGLRERTPAACRGLWYSHVNPTLDSDVPECSKIRRTSLSPAAGKKTRGKSAEAGATALAGREEESSSDSF